MRLTDGEVRRGSPLKSAALTQSFGSYHHEYLLVHTDHDIGLMTAEERKNFTAVANLGDQAKVAMREFALVHELRHFHDCFGTLAGASLFESYIAQIREFLRICRDLWKENGHWELPLDSWTSNATCPNRIRQFQRVANNLSLVRDLFLGVMQPQVGVGLSFESWRKFEYGSASLPLYSFPMSISRVRRWPDGREQEVERTTVWYPIAFESLIEGNAQALQRTLIEDFWSPDVAEKVLEMIGEREGEASFKRLASPYNITEFILNKYLKKFKLKTLSRRAVLELADATLMRVNCPVPSGAMVFRTLGEVFVSLVEGADWKKHGVEWERNINSRIWPPRASPEVFARDIERIRAAIPTFESRLKLSNDALFLDIVESYVTHKVILPILELRLKYGDEVMFDSDKYISHIGEFPNPPLRLDPEGLVSTLDADETPPFVRAWCEYVMVFSMIRQIIDNQVVIACPRAYSLIPGLGEVNCCYDGDCSEHVRTRDCMHWVPGKIDSLPHCVFRKCVELIRLDSVGH